MMIAVELIDILSGIREETEREREQLDFSIKHQGLLQRIVVVENDEVPGRYICLAGRRRLLSHRRLGLGMIDCLVTTGDALSRELVEVAENLIRLDLKPLERARQLKLYADLWEAKHPEASEAVRAQRLANLKGGEPRADRGADGAPVEVEGAPMGAIQAVAKATGKAPRTIYASVARAEKAAARFTPEQIAALDASGLGERRIDRITAIEDPDRRAQVVNLVAARMSYPAAMREVLGDEFEGDREEDGDVGDEEFLAACPIRPRVNTAKFDADALLYRQTSEARRSFARAIGWGRIKSEVSQKGLYFRRLLFLMDVPPPSEWLQCHKCTRGVTKVGDFVGECPACRGGGYLFT